MSIADRRTAAVHLFWVALLVLAAGLPTVLLAQGPPQGLPPQSSAVAQTVLEGELEVQIEDSDQGSRTHHFLNTANGRFRLELADDGPGWETGTIVRARGRMRDAGTLELGDGGSMEPMALANSNTFGEQKTVVILVNFQDLQTQPYSATTASNVTFTTTSNFYLENSHGQTWLTGTVVGWFTLPLSSASCDTTAISSYADQAAASAGVNLSNYKRKIYAFPKINACSWWGLGSVGGSPSRAWINGSYSLQVVAHELGHNFGDYHSRSMWCTTGSCTTSEYGDDADIMGNKTSSHMNAFQKERLGWLNYGDSPAILTVGQTGSYWIDTYAVNNPASAAPKALKILKSVDGNGKPTWYYVESRAKVGFDSGLTAGVVLHTGNEGAPREVYQMDVQPTTTTSDWRLDAGQSFEDTAVGVRITTLWADTTGAMIDVTFASAPCTANAPALSASPAGTVSTSAGTPVNFTVNVTNQDGAACSSSTFSIEGWVPSGWSASSTPASLTLAPGASASATVTITPSSSATTGADVQIGAYRSGGQGASVVRTVQITSTTTCSANTPSITTNPSGSVTTTAGTSVSYTVTVKNNDSSCSGSTFSLGAAVPSGWTASFSPASVSLASGASGSVALTITTPSTAVGSSTIQISATRASGSGTSVSRTIDVTSAPTGPISVSLAIRAAKGGYELKATVTSGSAFVSGAAVTFSASDGTQVVWSANASTSGSGVATVIFKPSKRSTATYTISATATAAGQTATATQQLALK